jgi:putative iron-dependent peroxidase
VKLLVAFGPDMMQKVTTDCPSPFANYETFKSIDGSGKEAKGTQEDMLVWIYSPKKDALWKAAFDLREGLKGNMKVARETQTFIYGDSLDMTGFADGTGNPEAHRDQEVGCIPDGQPGAGGAFLIAQRWVHDLSAFNKLSVPDQEKVFGRTKDGSVKLADVPNNAHLAKMDYREGANADDSKAKRDEITRRSTPYSHPAPPTGGDGVNGLYFIGFCRSQQPLIYRMNGMYGLDGSVRDRLTDFSNPASGSFYFAPSVQALDAM